MQHETRNWNNFDKCEPEQQYRLGTVSYKIFKIFIDTLNTSYKQIHPDVYFLTVKIVQKQEELSIYF